MMHIPNDPFMLFSYINTQLRDHFDSLDDLCQSLSLNKTEILDKLEKADFHYDPDLNKFL